MLKSHFSGIRTLRTLLGASLDDVRDSEPALHSRSGVTSNLDIDDFIPIIRSLRVFLRTILWPGKLSESDT